MLGAEYFPSSRSKNPPMDSDSLQLFLQLKYENYIMARMNTATGEDPFFLTILIQLVIKSLFLFHEANPYPLPLS